MKLLPTFLLLLTISASPAAVFAYDEAIQGEITDDYLNPLILTPGAGASTLQGTIAGGDRDLFTIVIGANLSLDSLVLLTYDTDLNNSSNVSYLLSQPGVTLTAPPSNEDPYPGGAIGYVGFGNWAENRNVLRFITAGPPYDYAPTLGPGSYAFWLNETGSSSDYSFQFNISSIPEPSTTALFSSALLLLHRRRRSQTNQFIAKFGPPPRITLLNAK